MDIKMQNLRNLKTTMRQVKFPVEYVAVQSCAQIVSQQTWNKQQQQQSNTEEAWWVEKVIRRYGGNLRDTFAETDRSAGEKQPCYLKDIPHAEAEANKA